MTTDTTDRTLMERRQALGLSREHLAFYAQCSVSSLSCLERGLQPKRSRVLKQAEACLTRLERAATKESDATGSAATRGDS